MAHFGWIAGLCGLAAGTAARGQSFIGLGMLPGATSSAASGVSGDGSVVVGTSGGFAFRWTRGGGMVSLGTLPGMTTSEAGGVSGDGAVVVGDAWISPNNYKAFRWTSGEGMTDLGSLAPGASSSAYATNGDGSVVVGVSGQPPFRWTSGGGMAALNMPGWSSGWATAVSSDGSVVAGLGCTLGACNTFRWTSAGGAVNLGSVPQAFQTIAWGISGDSSTIVGLGNVGQWIANRAFRWTAGTGMVDLGTLPGGEGAEAWGVSGDGSKVVGAGLVNFLGGYAMLWTPTLGMVNLNLYLPSLGINLTNWSLRMAYGISADGRTIVGYGLHDGVSEGWVATLGPPCYANCDGSWLAPMLNINDFVCFLNSFAAGATYANCDQSTTAPVLNVLDFTCFLNAFAAGCP